MNTEYAICAPVAVAAFVVGYGIAWVRSRSEVNTAKDVAMRFARESVERYNMSDIRFVSDRIARPDPKTCTHHYRMRTTGLQYSFSKDRYYSAYVCTECGQKTFMRAHRAELCQEHDAAQGRSKAWATINARGDK